MSTTQHTPETVAALSDLEDRDIRALTEAMTVLGDRAPAPADADGLYLVTSASGSSYVVEPTLGACECADAEYRDERCKHIRRVAFETGARVLPPMIDTDAVDDQFRQFVTPEPEDTSR